MSKLTVSVLMGGPDAERDISIQSGTAVATALEQSGSFNVHKQIIDTPTIEDIRNIEADVIFPVLHGPFGEGGPLQQLLEETQKTFVGSGSEAAALAMDKDATKRFAVQEGIQTPAWCLLTPKSQCDIDPPIVLKPVEDGSSVGISICLTLEEVEAQRHLLLQERSEVLAETFVQGRELTVGIIGGVPQPIIEIIPPHDLQTYDYEAKYERDDTQYIIAPTLPANQCVEVAISLYGGMGIRDIARVDFILNETGTWLLEINTMPGFTNHSLIPMASRHLGIEMPELCSSLVEFAATRRIK